MDRVVNFYARLPRGAAPETKATGLLGRYQARYFSGKNASAARELPSPLDIVLSLEIIVRRMLILREQLLPTPLVVSCSLVMAWNTTSTSVSRLLWKTSCMERLLIDHQATTRTTLIKPFSAILR